MGDLSVLRLDLKLGKCATHSMPCHYRHDVAFLGCLGSYTMFKLLHDMLLHAGTAQSGVLAHHAALWGAA